jgi:signal transduction histidine kinase
MFSKARIRLTAWYAGVLAAFLVLLGTAVYLVERHQLLGNVNHGLHVQAARIQAAYLDQGYNSIIALSDGAPSAYRVSLTDAIGQGNNPINQDSARAALINGSDMRTVSTPGGHLRVFSERISPTLVLQVARSLEPEEEALDHLLAVLLLGGGAAIVIAAIGGWFLAGKALTPVQQAFERQNVFVADASHELRTPLAVIRANAEFLQVREPASEEAAEIVSETDRLTALVDSLLAVARGDGANGGVSYDDLDLGAVVEGSATSMRSLATDRGIGLDVSAEPELRVRGSREQLRQLVVILVDNALRYTGEGGRVAVDVAGRDGSAVMAVSDTGIGIPADALDHVFERFYRADDARSRDSGGAGLGLAIARKLVEEHGGRIAAESTPGEGSTFTVTLPLVR